MHKCEGNDSIVKKKKNQLQEWGERWGKWIIFFPPFFFKNFKFSCECLAVKPHYLLYDEPFHFLSNSTHVRTRTYTYTRNVNIPFGLFLNFKSPAPLSLSLSFSVFPKLHAFQYIAPGMRACVRWLSRRSPSLSFSPYSLLKKKKNYFLLFFFFFSFLPIDILTKNRNRKNHFSIMYSSFLNVKLCHFTLYIFYSLLLIKKKEEEDSSRVPVVEEPYLGVKSNLFHHIESHRQYRPPRSPYKRSHTLQYHYGCPFLKEEEEEDGKKTDVIWRFSIVKKEEGARSFLGNTTRLFMTLFGRVWIIFGLDSPTFKVALHKPKPKTQKQKTLSK